MEEDMEPCLNTRKAINSHIMIFISPTGFIKASIKNISADGMLVDTGQSTLPMGAVVELAGAGAWQLESKLGLPKALITHTDKDGHTTLTLL
jgi:hypothetical protein